MNQLAVRDGAGQLARPSSSPFEGFRLLDHYAKGAVVERPRVDALATISAGYRDKDTRNPVVSRDHTIYLHDPEGRAPGLAAALRATKGKALTIAVVSDVPSEFLQMRFAAYSASALLAFGDADAVQEFVRVGGTDKDPKMERRVHAAGTPDYERVVGTCKTQGSLYFALAEWGEDGAPSMVWPDGFGLYRLRFTSRNSLRSLVAGFDQIARLTGGRLKGVPFTLRLANQDVAGPDGKRRSVPVWSVVFQPPGGMKLTPAAFSGLVGRAIEGARELSLPAPAAETAEAIEAEFQEIGADVDLDAVTQRDVDLAERGGRCDVKRWRNQWHAVVAGTKYEDAAARSAFLGWFTQGAYASLAELLANATEAEARELLDEIRTTIRAEKAAADAAKPARTTEALRAELGIGDEDGASDDRAEDRRIVGARSVSPNVGDGDPVRPDDGAQYTLNQWRGLYVAWKAVLAKLDPHFPFVATDSLTPSNVREAVRGLIANVDEIRAVVADDEDDGKRDDAREFGL